MVQSRINQLIDVCKKAVEGPSCSTYDFNVKFLPKKIRELVKAYDIKFNPDTPLPSDNNLADSVFKAGWDLLADIGILCLDTNRLIKFTDDEIKHALRKLQKQYILGAGKDARRIFHRPVENRQPPLLFGGLAGSPLTSGQSYLDTLVSMAKEPRLDILESGSLQEVDGIPVIKGSPLELHAAKCEAEWMREAVRQVGRPGMHLVGSCPETDSAEIANSNPDWGYRPCDGRNVTLIASLKTTFNQLNKIKHFIDYGTFIYTYMCDLVGGYSGGAEGTAITSVATHLANLLLYQAHYQSINDMHIHHVNTTNRMTLWVQNIVAQAIGRNTNIITAHTCTTSAGPSTEMILYESAVVGLSITSGGHVLGVLATSSKLRDHYTGLEQRFLGEVTDSSVNLKREDANELITRILPQYEDKFSNPPLGKTLQQCYNLKTMKPTKEWFNIYKTVKKNLIDLGLRLDQS